ncbi:MAG: acetate uptake transporter [Mycobacterium sp.]
MTIIEDQPVPTSAARELLPDIGDPTAGSVAMSRELASEQVRMIADPAPLGLAAFALTTFLLSLVNAGVMPKDTEPVMLGVALAFGGIAQLLAGMWEFRKGNVFGATVFSSYGAFWLSFWAYVTFYAQDIPAEHHGIAAGWYLIAWAIFTSLMLIAALRTTVVLAVLFAVLDVTFVLLALGALFASPGLTVAGGVLGLATAALAWYLCVAAVAASTFGRPVLPNPPLFQP